MFMFFRSEKNKSAVLGMISEDWSNDAENTALIAEINYSLTHIHEENRHIEL